MDYKVFGRGTAGNTIPIVVRVREKVVGSRDMPLTPANGVSCTISSPTGASVASSSAFLLVEGGVYLYNWDTTGLSAGTYKVVISVNVAFSGDEVTQSGIVRLY